MIEVLGMEIDKRVLGDKSTLGGIVILYKDWHIVSAFGICNVPSGKEMLW